MRDSEPPGQSAVELGKLKEAKSSYEAALKLNPMNSIAKRNAARINALLHQKEGLKVGGTRVDLNLFVEEMGKTVITIVESSRRHLHQVAPETSPSSRSRATASRWRPQGACASDCSRRSWRGA